MKKHFVAAMLAAGVAAAPLSSAWAGPGQGAHAVIIADRVTLDWDVVGIDRGLRVLSLKDASGHVAVVSVGAEVRNLDQVQPGDQVQLNYTDELYLAFKKGAGVRMTGEITEAARAAPGNKPAAIAVREVEFVADIIKFDIATGALSVKGAKGRIFDLKVKDPKIMQGFTVGDQVQGDFLQVLEIVVLKAQNKS